MSILSSELKFYGSNVMPDDDSTNNIGGAIATTKKIEFTQMTANSALEVVSSAAGDTTQTVTVTGRKADGTISTAGPVTLNGTTAVSLGATVFERILKVVLSASTAGTVTVRNSGAGTAWCTLEPGITELRVPFYNAVADATGGSAKTYYEKVFVKNTNGSLALTAAQIIEQADPSGKITFAVAGTLDDSGTNGAGNNRQVAPSGLTFDSAAKSVATGDLSSGSAQGVWLKLSLAAGDAAAKSSYTLRVSGNSI